MARLLDVTHDKDAELITHRLFEAFGSLSGIFSATQEAIDLTVGTGVAKLLASARLACEESLRETVYRSQCNALSQGFREYLRARFALFREETMLVFFLDNESRLICDEVVGTGGIASLRISGRALFRRAMELNAVGLILAHNHPSGDATPSDSDIDATKALASAAGVLDIRLADHLIVGRQGIMSMRMAGLL